MKGKKEKSKKLKGMFKKKRKITILFMDNYYSTRFTLTSKEKQQIVIYLQIKNEKNKTKGIHQNFKKDLRFSDFKMIWNNPFDFSNRNVISKPNKNLIV